ncbi:TPA: VENN motif pre-toxin domain-containing protein, partial [Haemophilus influenzae]
LLEEKLRLESNVLPIYPPDGASVHACAITIATQSAICGNIQIETETPRNLTALSRDTKNANQRVEKQDLQKVQERQEMAKVIGDISNNAISIATYNEREKINKLSLEKFKAEEKYGKSSTQAQEIGKQITAIQNDIDGTYGIGSKTGMAIRAVTAALQAAAQNDTAGSLVALASPYLNKTIHEMTAGDTAKDKATNLMAHALLSAVEFQVTGKDPLTGAIAGVTGEATAEIIARAYGKPVSELTVNEKENISTLSQLAGGLAAALTAKANGTTVEQGGSFLAATSGAETAKRAVENNLLSKNEDEELFKISEKFEKEKELKQKEKNRGGELLKKDSYINFLIRLNQKDPSQLTEGQKNYLAVELHKIARSWNVPVSDLYNWDFSKEIKRNDSALTKYLSDEIKFWDSYVGKQAQSFAIGALAAGGGVAAVRVIPKAAGYLQETAVLSARNPVAAEMLVTGGYKAGEISYKAHSGQYKTEDELKSAVYDGAKDVIKVPLLSKLKPGAQALNSFAFDLMYEVNKPGATDRQIKTEMIGSSAGSGFGFVAETISNRLGFPPLPKTFLNTIGGAIVSDKAKETYQDVNKEKK